MSAASEIRLAAVVGFVGVGLGAFGAHGLSVFGYEGRPLEIWRTAVFYHLLHAVVLLVVGLSPRVSKVATIAFVLGIILFSGSLYLLVLSGWGWMGAITPLGGMAFLVGWAAMLGMGWRANENERLEAARAAAFAAEKKSETEKH